MRRPALLFACLAVALLAVPAGASAASKPSASRIGVMAAGASNKKVRLGVPNALGVLYVRPNVAVRIGLANQNLTQLDDTRAAGFRLILNINNAPVQGKPASAPADLAAYSAAVGKALDTYKPEVAVIENEELADKFYTGTPRQYLAELDAAVVEAHKRNLKITNGGIVSSAVLLATWNDYWTRGLRKQADDFAKRAFPPSRLSAKVQKDLPTSADPKKPILGNSPIQKRLLREAGQLITGYRKSAIDYVNFHWYQAGSKALKESIDFLERATRKRAMTNEIGQFDRNATTVTSLLSTVVSKQLPYVVWFGGDGSGGAVGLFDKKGGKLRPNGNAFRDFVAANPGPQDR
jgi:hypothetical protein